MKILVIGDPHGAIENVRKAPVKGVDLILLTGDIGKADLARKRYFENIERKQKGLDELEYDGKFAKQVHQQIHNSTIEILKYLSRYAPVYSLQGNVGIPTLSDVKKDYKKYGIKLASTREKVDSMKNVNLVKNRVRIIDGLRIGFLEYFVDTNWVQDFKPSDYKKRLKKAKMATDKARDVLKRFGNLDILVCHQPPYGYLDKVSGKFGAPKSWQGKHAGSKVILEYIKKYQPKYVFCGHIHEGRGRVKIGKTQVYNMGFNGEHIVVNI
ncbi:MAG: metallophosphoesterase [Nanoarchaeota archaeon]